MSGATSSVANPAATALTTAASTTTASTTTASTTITYADGFEPLIHYQGPTPMPLHEYINRSTIETLRDHGSVATLGSGFTLYVPTPISTGATLTISALINALDSNSVPALPTWSAYFRLNQSAALLSPVEPVVTFGTTMTGTLFVPFIASLSDQVQLDALQQRLAPPTSVAPAHSTPNGAPSSTTSSVSSGLPSSSATSNSSSTSTSKPGGKFDGGALAGGIIGGIILGALIAAIFAWWCFRRRNRKLKGKAALAEPGVYSLRTASHEGSQGDNDAVLGKSVNVTGWEKHLPQEKDDRTIIDAVRTVFNQVQIHVEGFYTARSGATPDASMRAVETFPCDDLSTKLPQARNPLPLLEGIMLRWIVHKISLRCPAQESFLRLDFAQIPQKRGWHMEVDGQENGVKGDSEAFSRWRVLTNYISSGANEDQESHDRLKANIDSGIEDFAAAFRPWAIPSKNEEQRKESLRQIFQQASDTGMLLFAQPSTFLFEWSTHDNKRITINPTLVRRADRGNKYTDNQILIKAKELDSSSM